MKKYILATLLFVIAISLLLFFSLLFSSGGLFLKMDLTADYSLRKELFANKYNLVWKKNGERVVDDIGDWIIAKKYIYGRVKEKGNYFLINRESGDIELFFVMHDLSQRLKQLGLERYDMSREESFVHLKYHKRVYSLKH